MKEGAKYVKIVDFLNVIKMKKYEIELKYTWVCEYCASDDIEFGGYGWWNHTKQEIEWEWSDNYCRSCEDAVSVTQNYSYKLPRIILIL